MIAAFVIVRPVNYDDVPNSSYLKLSEMLESGRMLLQENMPIYHFGMDADFRANYRGLLYYTELELTGMLRTDEEAANRMKESGTFYLIVDKRDLTEFLVSNLIVKADLGKSLLMSR
jgi:hypothetical protein